jgi:hypothetical protein
VPDSRTPAATGIEASPAESSSGIFIRLWSNDEQRNKPLAVSWETRNGIVYMIADLIKANDGKLAGEVQDALVAQFLSPVKAITAARRIQRCVMGFAAATLEGRSAAGIAIYGQAGSFPATFGASTTVPTNLLDYAQPGRIILSEKTASQLGRFPGLPLRKVSPRDSDQAASGDHLWELLWAPTRSSARFVDQIDLSRTATTAADGMGASAKGAELAALARLPLEESVGRDRGLQATSYAGMVGAPARDEAARPGDPTFEIRPDAYPAEIPPGDNSSDDEILPSGGSHWFWPLTIGSAVALALIFSVLIFQSRARVPQAPATEPNQASPEKSESPDVSKTKAATQGKNSDQPEVPLEQVKPAPQGLPGSDETQPQNPEIPTNPPANPSEARSLAEGNVDKKQPQELKATPRSVDDFSSSEIPLLLRRAEQDAGSGNYVAAQREYNIILRLDPGNAAAKQGLHRLELSAGESHQ